MQLIRLNVPFLNSLWGKGNYKEQDTSLISHERPFMFSSELLISIKKTHKVLKEKFLHPSGAPKIHSSLLLSSVAIWLVAMAPTRSFECVGCSTLFLSSFLRFLENLILNLYFPWRLEAIRQLDNHLLKRHLKLTNSGA